MSDALPSSLAIVTAPTFDECDRISEVVSHSVGRYSASWMTRSATWIEYGSRNLVDGVTIPCDSAPAIVTSLNVDPGSYVSVTALFRCVEYGTLCALFAS